MIAGRINAVFRVCNEPNQRGSAIDKGEEADEANEECFSLFLDVPFSDGPFLSLYNALFFSFNRLFLNFLFPFLFLFAKDQVQGENIKKNKNKYE